MYKVIFFLCLSAYSFLPQTVDAQSSPVTGENRAIAMNHYINGLTAFETDDYEAAVRELQLAYQIIPDYAGIHFALADTYLAMGDLANAEYYGNMAIAIEPENKWYSLKLASIYRQARRTDDLREILQSALAYHPDDLNILMQLATLNSNLGNYLEANRIYKQVLSLRGDNFDIYENMYQNFRNAGLRDSSLAVLHLMRDMEPDDISSLHALSRFYLESGRDEEALAILHEARSRNSRNPQTLILLASIYISEAQWDSLGHTFITMIEDALIPASNKMELARFLYLEYQSSPNQTSLTEQTRRVLEQFSASEPAYGNAHLLAAEFYLNRNELPAAIEKLELANNVMPESADAWNQRLQLMFNSGRYEEVIQTGLEASTYIQDNAFLQFYVGTSYLVTDRPVDAIDWLEQATLSPARSAFRSVIYSTLGDTFHELGRWEQSAESFETALQLDRQNHNAMNNYAYFMSVRGERLEYARELALQAIRMDPSNAAYLDTVGWIYYQIGEYDEARRYIQSSIDTGDASAEVMEHLGDVYEKLENMDAAEAWWERALEMDPDRTYLQEKIQ